MATTAMSAHDPAPGLAGLETALRASQHLTQAVIDSLAAHIAVLDRDGAIIATNAAWTRFARDNAGGPPHHTGVGANYLVVCRRASGDSSEGAAEVEAGLRALLSGAGDRFQYEYPCHSSDQQRWFLLQATGLEGGSGGAVLLHIDITERKRTEGTLLEAERLKTLTAGLLAGQEEERRRIARELHDGLNQTVTALGIGLGVLARRLPDPARAEIYALQRRTVDLSEQVRRISHQLHPAVLEHVGLGAALRSLCEEYEQAHPTTLRLTVGDACGDVAPPQALCLYRVAQECLRNIARHAGATEAVVILRRSGDHLELTVKDNGRGFEPAGRSGLSGLGLASMAERVSLAGGRLAITSEPGRGASIDVRIPALGTGEAIS